MEFRRMPQYNFYLKIFSTYFYDFTHFLDTLLADGKILPDIAGFAMSIFLTFSEDSHAHSQARA